MEPEYYYEEETDLVPHGIYRLTQKALEKDSVVMDLDNKATWNRKHPEHRVAISTARIYKALSRKELEFVPDEKVEPSASVVLERVVDDEILESVEAPLVKQTAKTFTVELDGEQKPLYVREGWRIAEPE
jgi:hypothetical protein